MLPCSRRSPRNYRRRSLCLTRRTRRAGSCTLENLPRWEVRCFCYDSGMAFFTGKGYEGLSKLFDSEKGKRVTKAAPVFECLGQLDELNSLVGWCKAASGDLVFEGQKMK